jgi:glyoxylase-like metal-dependent hydrolase (beta-lactamase superfamily II)
MELRYLGHAAVALSDGGTTVLIDPFLTGNPRAAASADELEATTILVSHGHGDHLGDTVPIAKRTGATRAGAEDVARAFASKVPEGEKLRDVPHRLEAGMPILDAALAWVVCDLRELIPAGDHEIAIGEVVAMDVADGDPLLWYRGAYRSLAG